MRGQVGDDATPSRFRWPDGTSWTPPTTEELLSRGAAAVAREYLRPLPRLPRTLDSAAPAINGRRVRGDVDVNAQRTGKSRKALSSDDDAKRNAVCNSFLKGRCLYAERCKFSHDLELYLAQKQPDLPGECPFGAASTNICPHGAACRYYGSHPPATNDGSYDSTADLHQASRVLLEAAREKNAAAAASSEVHTLALPLPIGAVQDELNQLAVDLKLKLRKNSIKFSRADAVLASMGVKTTSRSNGKCSGFDEAGTKRRKGENGGITEGIDVAEVNAVEQNAFRRMNAREKQTVDFSDKLYLAPLTTVGNLPFRRVCKGLGADITCGEMAMCTNLLQGQPNEWALLRRHPSEDLFGVQICGGYSDSVARCSQLIDDVIVSQGGCDFVDINMGCPIDLVCNKGGGSMLLERHNRMEQIARSASSLLSCPLTLKTRTGYYDNKRVAHDIVPKLKDWGVAAVTLHGRSRQQRYSRLADWEYIKNTANVSSVPLIGNGDVFNFRDYEKNVEGTGVMTCMIARGALIKPWIFTEIKERRDWDISATERLDMLKRFAAYGLEHWGSDERGVENTRRFLLEWLSFLHRYIPVGLLEVVPTGIHQRPPSYVGRNELETLFASTQAEDWVKITTMLLGPPPAGFNFVPKHKSNAYGAGEKGAALADFDGLSAQG
jgi:tRNA-dihydrouridine synthase 3